MSWDWGWCYSCANLAGCPHPPLGANLPCHAQASDKQRSVRDAVLDHVDIKAAVLLIQRLPRLGKNEEDMIDPTPDFYSMLYEGITKPEREEQLRYELKENGQVWLDEDGRKRPRGDFLLRRYAQEHPHEDFPRIDNGRSIGWTLDEIVGYILRSEAEIGLIAKKPKKEKEMPTGKRVNTVRTKGAAGKMPGKKTNSGGKVAKPPSRGKAVAKKTGPAPETPSANAEATMESLMAQVVAVREQLDAVESKMQSVIGDLATTTIEKINEIVVRIEDANQKIVDSLGIMHDLHVDTEGRFHYEEMETDDNGNIIQAVDEEGQALVDEDGDPIPNMIMVPLDKVMPHFDDEGNQIGGSDEGILKYFSGSESD